MTLEAPGLGPSPNRRHIMRLRGDYSLRWEINLEFLRNRPGSKHSRCCGPGRMVLPGSSVPFAQGVAQASSFEQFSNTLHSDGSPRWCEGPPRKSQFSIETPSEMSRRSSPLKSATARLASVNAPASSGQAILLPPMKRNSSTAMGSEMLTRESALKSPGRSRPPAGVPLMINSNSPSQESTSGSPDP